MELTAKIPLNLNDVFKSFCPESDHSTPNCPEKAMSRKLDDPQRFSIRQNRLQYNNSYAKESDI
jgi:hypothetical protein